MITEQSKRCIVSFANERGRYLENLLRLKQSLVGKFDGDFLGFVGEDSVGAPLHIENPYAFKIHAIRAAIEVGYTSVLWLDSSCYAIRNLAPVFKSIERDGMIFQEAGHMLGTWSTDSQLEYFGLTRDEAMGIGMIGNAGFLGFDFTNPIASRFFVLWNKAMEQGMFKGSWENSRHDMTCSSALVHLMGLSGMAKKGNEWLQYAAPEDSVLNDTILIKAQG